MLQFFGNLFLIKGAINWERSHESTPLPAKKMTAGNGFIDFFVLFS